MQGEFNFEHGGSNAVIDQHIHWDNIGGDHEQQRDLHRFSLGQASSSGGTKALAASHSEQWMEMARFEERRNGKLDSNPLFSQQPPSGNRVVRNVNLNAEYNEGMNPVTAHPGLCEVNRLRSGSSGDGHGASRKRKARDISIGESSSCASSSVPAFYIPKKDRNISLNHSPRGLASNAVPNSSSPAIAESSNRNFSVRANPTDQQETLNPSVFSVIRRPVAPSMNSTGLAPNNQQPIDLRYRNNVSATRIPPVSRNTIPPFQWSSSSSSPVAACSAAPVDRNVVHRDGSRQRSQILANPFFLPAPEQRNIPHSHISRNARRHVALSSSTTSVQPSPTHVPNHQRGLSEHLRMSMLSSLAANQRSTRSVVLPAAPNQHVLQSGVHSRAGPRQGQNASTSRGRSRLAASEIRNVLEHMRRTMRYEDVMLLRQSMALGVADIHDRYRHMRLDVDNMTYEELLSLEERIGDVCTGVNEETLSKDLQKQIYRSSSSSSSTGSPQEVEPCCICQEEYKEGEEMGILECGHDFHTQCIKEWLKRKNLCPICKTTGLNTAEKPR